MGISAFVVDWYGDREPFIDASFALMQTVAARQNFHVAIIYDETNQEDGATDETIADFNMFHEAYLSSKGAGSQTNLMYAGRPVIFIFPK
jgi:Na+-transporting NADH:ubiquinone oxidoreductase subunit NqrF